MSDEVQGLPDPAIFLNLRKHIRIAHHIPGRIRLRIGAEAVTAAQGVDDDLLDRVLAAIGGIEDVRVNAMAGSSVISYQPEKIRPEWWETLLHGEDAESVDLLRRLAEKELAPALDAARSDRV
ncbi:HMA2 domain-containing protein [Lentisalinibacter sediminis]|uniref:HMA2 domain-containing protein n=1 Tax=Lentisalinibacter sediminis TaxID=2992237 RepID=UPI003869EABD